MPTRKPKGLSVQNDPATERPYSLQADWVKSRKKPLAPSAASLRYPVYRVDKSQPI